jgi:Hint module
MKIFLLLPFLVTFLPCFVAGAEHLVDWNIPTSPATSLPPRTAFPGDTFFFQWYVVNHTVSIHPTKTCSTVGSVLVPIVYLPNSAIIRAVYTFTKADMGDMVFASDARYLHAVMPSDPDCAHGLILTVTVKDPLIVEWAIPVEGVIQPRYFHVGDTITFQWSGNHNVYTHVVNKPICSKTGAILVGNTSGTKYTFKSSDIGTVVFASDVGNDCDSGFRMDASVTQKPGTISLCFSDSGRVHVESKGWVTMAALQIGDRVLVNGNKYEPVYSFGHRDAGGYGEYLEIHSNSTSDDPLHISRNHMILLGGERWVPASAVRVGDSLSLSSGKGVVVTKIRNVTQQGMYAPFTASGSIVVNDIVASTFIAFQESEYLKLGDFDTPFTFQWLAHTFESWHRIVCSSGLVDCREETYTACGVSHWVAIPHRFAGWFVQQSAAVSCVLFVILLLPFGGFLLLLEHPMWVCILVGAFTLAVRTATSMKRKLAS